MADVIIALAPAMLVSVWCFGWASLKLLLTSVAVCVAVEYLIQKFVLKEEPSIGDLSAVVTGILLALNLPTSAPCWLVAVGAVVAIGVAKMTFGGLGQNVFNPALVGRVFLLISFPALMTNWTVDPQSFFAHADAFSGATPLALANEGQIEALSASQLLFVRIGGSAGEVSALALILGFVYLLARRVIKPHITLSIWVTVALMTTIFFLCDSEAFTGPVFNLLTGGLLLGSIFMATDYVTSPMTAKGQIIFGVGIGVITVLIRYFGSFPEGVSFAILIMNCVVPLLNSWCKPKRFA